VSVGLLALLDDVAALVKVTAASLDDIAAQAAKAGAKAAGVVIDDAAVTPKYVVGLSPARELPIVWNIAKGSLKNKFIFLLPAALLLGWLAPWAISPLLAFGGLFLCFEGYEKLHEIAHRFLHPLPEKIEDIAELEVLTPEQLEALRTSSAIRTDLILSAEIMAISYATVSHEPFLTQAASLAFVSVGITVAVYGFVALVVKADDVGLHLAKESHTQALRAVGRGIVTSMPILLTLLSYVGMAAMLWVGGGIVLHNVPFLHGVVETVEHMLPSGGFTGWVSMAAFSAVFGAVVGFACEKMVGLVRSFRKAA
jgi:uncharacterized protein